MALRQAYWSASSMSIQSRRVVKSFHHMTIITVTGLASMPDPRLLESGTRVYLSLANIPFKIVYRSVNVVAHKISKNKQTIDSFKTICLV
jgi:hypothetical protein